MRAVGRPLSHERRPNDQSDQLRGIHPPHRRREQELDRLRFREKLQVSGKAPRNLTLILPGAAVLIYYHDGPYEWWKNWYYTMKLKIEEQHKEAIKEAASYFSSALIWYYEYLTKQTVDWDCAYHELYAPTLSDVASISEHEGRVLSCFSCRRRDRCPVKLEKEPAMTRLEYLLCVLPGMDASFLPETHQCMVTDDESCYRKLYKDTLSSTVSLLHVP